MYVTACVCTGWREKIAEQRSERNFALGRVKPARIKVWARRIYTSMALRIYMAILTR
jgi:hypothetical protein